MARKTLLKNDPVCGEQISRSLAQARHRRTWTERQSEPHRRDDSADRGGPHAEKGFLNIAIGSFGLAASLGATFSTTLAGWIADRYGLPMAFLALSAVRGRGPPRRAARHARNPDAIGY
jgi:hypothetical protein